MKPFSTLLCGCCLAVAAFCWWKPQFVMADEERSQPKSAKQDRSSAKQVKQLEEKLKKLEAELRAAQRKNDEGVPSSRYQMSSAGSRVVILDTHSGETKIIEPEPETVQQRVEIGKSWVTVTVLVNAGEVRKRLAAPPKKLDPPSNRRKAASTED